MAVKKNKPFEEQLKRLEEIVNILDAGDAPIEELLKQFEEGMELVKELRNYLNKAELKVIEITKKLEKEIETEDNN
ncbi:MAG: exodeoxyribonuclease VII small subunit [Ignavibacteria bacterium GWB2_35_12]|nr:MAG: exodeoxyribonuclease VII small subunit [Ignavibacteria bacterium GWB2_35_12]OGV23622.1 MAG: exodeoxyribonuclease VII small subunit [Ignavibacteria bacterium RIFOXYC2_FULL_35_21]